MHSVLTLQTPRLGDYGELAQVWEDSVRATPVSYTHLTLPTN